MILYNCGTGTIKLCIALYYTIYICLGNNNSMLWAHWGKTAHTTHGSFLLDAEQEKFLPLADP